MSDDVSVVRDQRRITLEQLRVFVLVGQPNGGFNRAAGLLHRTQSAVTQSLKQLETSLGCRLIERQRGHVLGLTADGQRLMPSAVDILRRTAEAVSAMRQPPLSGRLRLAVPDDFSITDLQAAISRFARFNSGLRLEIMATGSTQILALLQEGELDLAVFHTLEPISPIFPERSSILKTETLHWVGLEKVYLGNLKHVPLVLFSHDCGYSQRAIGLLERRGIDHYPAYVSTSYDNLRGAIAQGLGIGILPASMIEPPLIALTGDEDFPALGKVSQVMTNTSNQPEANQLGQFLRSVNTMLDDSQR